VKSLLVFIKKEMMVSRVYTIKVIILSYAYYQELTIFTINSCYYGVYTPLLHPLPDVYREYGKKKINQIYAYNKKAQTTGEVIMKVSE